MAEQGLEKIVFPIRFTDFRSDPILKGLLDRIHTPEDINFNPYHRFAGIRGFGTMGVIDVQSTLSILEEAKNKGTLEPLATLVYSFLPKTYMRDKDNFDEYLAPYHRHLDFMIKELSKNISFEP